MRKNVIITGAAGNLGRASVLRFSKDGYFVIAAVAPGETLNVETGGNVVVHPVDLRDEKGADDFVSSMIRGHGTIDAALLLVGGYAGGSVDQTRIADLKKMIALNFDTAYNMVRPIFLQMMKQSGGGRIVLVGARAALEPKSGSKSLAYSLSKSMLFNLAAMLNAEGEARNIVTSVIVPSTIDTPQNRRDMPKADFSLWVKPEEIADVLAFITSESAHPLSDTVFKVYGNRRPPVG